MTASRPIRIARSSASHPGGRGASARLAAIAVATVLGAASLAPGSGAAAQPASPAAAAPASPTPGPADRERTVPSPPADAASAVASDPQAASARGGEPQVRRIVVEDDGARVEELRIRGITRRIHVQPKRAGAAAYEILPPDASQHLDDGSSASRGARGQRVWNVLDF